MRRNARGELVESGIRAGLAHIGRRGFQLAERNVLHLGREGSSRRHVDLLMHCASADHSALADTEELEIV